MDTTEVQTDKSYCYRVTFRHRNSCNPPSGPEFYESPFSNTDCSQVCSPPPLGPMDVAFIVDNTGSMFGSLSRLQQGIATVLDDIAAASEGDYRLALAPPNSATGHDHVDVRVSFPGSGNNRNEFVAALGGLTAGSGGNEPESTDECLNTVVNADAHVASTRTNPDDCDAVSDPLQYGDFTPFDATRNRQTVHRLVVLITDNPPTGFCDHENFEPTVDGVRAHSYAQDARNASSCIKINAILVTGAAPANENAARSVMQDYATTACGWYSELPFDGDGIEEAIIKMFYHAGACACP